MKKDIFLKVFQITTVFIGTLVGAGLASGREITQFFTNFGYKSFIGIFICLILYITTCSMLVHISTINKLTTYNELFSIISPGLFGKSISVLTTLFMLSSASIILAGSGALIHQYFGVSKWFGTIFMILLTIFILFRDTKGLIEINMFIVPCLITVIITIFVLYIIFSGDKLFNIDYIKSIPVNDSKNNWILSTFLYGGFNVLCSCGVMVPLSKEMKNLKVSIIGIICGSVGLILLTVMINLMLLINTPYIYKYEIPLLYIANRFGPLIQIMILLIIWFEMFSTEVSDIYSIGKSIENKFKIPFKKNIFLIIFAAICISQIGFSKLISIIYPIFGFISIIFVLQSYIYYFKKVLK